MLISVILANLLILVEQCQSQVLRNDRQYSIQYELQTYTQESEFLQASRPKANQYQYQYELAQNYQPEAIYQQSYAPSSVTSTRVSRPKQEKNQPVVEQYLKEVTPTTKTVYEPIPYQYSNQVPILKQAQYVLEQEPQQRPYVPQSKYEIPEAATASPVAQNTLAYHNVLLAHQNAIYDKQRTPNQPQKPSQGPPPKSAIFITQSIPKKPKVVKIVKPKTSTLDEEIDYLTKLQYRQQQLQQQSKDNEANQFKYQSRIPQYAKPELLTAEEEQAQIHQPRIASPLLLAKPIKVQRLPSYQPQYQQSITYQPEIAYQHQPQQYEQPQLIQYQPQPREQLRENL
ncbi:altered inheritance of mitochondria protein 3-like [Sitophilus oryzae]|uniref:Altered inheritance of mitochondria protein 3-like n=1 Tax=Sitophilus oryzae TaxID=7048 RepID=A0A6J2XCB7_SITOR|nr:altered inheritance of mitochondria protein 3-like [Sitophilus oryzae]